MKKPKKELFSRYYGIKENPEKFDFFDIYLNADSLFFVDAAKIKHEANRKSEYQYLFIRMQNTIDSFFKSVENIYENLSSHKEIYLAENTNKFKGILGQSKETQSTHLGFSKIGSSGTGNSYKILKDAFDYVYMENLYEPGLVNSMEDLTLFTKNFANDRMSDLIISLIIPELAEFSLLQAEKYKISDTYISKKPIKLGHKWDNETMEWVLYKDKAIEYMNRPVLLVPFRLISRNFLYDPKKYLSHSLYRRQDEYKKIKSHYNGVNKDGSIKPPSHKTIKEVEIKESNLSTKQYLILRTQADKDLKATFFTNIKHALEAGATVLTIEEIEAYRRADEKKDK